MSSNYQNPAFKKLLQKLQEESWQLELLISGFAIFGLFTAYPEIKIHANEAKNFGNDYAAIAYMVISVSCLILIFNLLLHVILRGLWIGALGLRYVSGDIDYEKLNYSPKFTNSLKKKIGSFDRYINTLENYCSVIFAVTFLLIFYVLAITFTISTLVFIATYFIDNENLPAWLSKGVGVPFIIFMIVGILLTFFDFITQGWLKKKQWISKIYFPIYWVFSFITLSFLYRPLVYNFLDNKFTKRISMVLVPIYVLILISTSIEFRQSNYIDFPRDSSSYYASNQNYEDMLTEKGQFIRTAAIPSKVIKDSYLKIFIVFDERIEDRIFTRNESLKPNNDKRGLNSKISFSDPEFDFGELDSIKRLYMKEFNKIYDVVIDSTSYDSNFILGKSTTEEFGFETYIDIAQLPKGKHLLKLQRDAYTKKDTSIVTFTTIPFWYFKD